MSRLVLVRHAMPVPDPDVDSKRWGLAPGAFAEAEALASALPGDVAGPVWTSDETKAIETARAIARARGFDVATDERFGEVERPWSDGDYRSLAERYASGDDLDGWEPRASVIERFTAAVADASTEGGTTVVVDHGLAMTVYLASVTPIDPAPFWKALTFPDAWMLEGGALVRVHRSMEQA